MNTWIYYALFLSVAWTTYSLLKNLISVIVTKRLERKIKKKWEDLRNSISKEEDIRSRCFSNDRFKKQRAKVISTLSGVLEAALSSKTDTPLQVSLVDVTANKYACKINLPDSETKLVLPAEPLHSVVEIPMAYIALIDAITDKVVKEIDKVDEIADKIKAFIDDTSLLCVNNSIPVTSIRAEKDDETDDEDLILDISFKDKMKVKLNVPLYLLLAYPKNKKEAMEYMLDKIVSERIGFTK